MRASSEARFGLTLGVIGVVASLTHLALSEYRQGRAASKYAIEGQLGDRDPPGLNTSSRTWTAQRGGYIAVVEKSVWLCTNAALLALATTNLAKGALCATSILELIFALYLSALASMVLCVPKPLRVTATADLKSLSLFFFALHAYDDLSDFALIGGPPPPLRASARDALFFISGVVIPLVVPRETSKWRPSAAETSSWGSYLVCSYVDPVVLNAYWESHVPIESLPFLEEGDSIGYLATQQFSKINPGLLSRRRHVSWSLLDIFRRDYLIIFLLSLLQVTTTYVAPVGINRLLAYLEGSGTSRVKPWIWIIWIALGPFVACIVSQLASMRSTIVSIRAEALLTQLIFDQMLRIRIQADTDGHPYEKDMSKPNTVYTETETATSFPSGSPAACNSANADDSALPDADTVQDTVTLPAQIVADDAVTEGENITSQRNPPDIGVERGARRRTWSDRTDKNALTGMVNNLLTTDLKTIIDARDFLDLVMAGLHIIGSVVFLYIILGWSSLVGAAIILITLPIPSWTAKFTMSSEKAKMQASDSRVQAITQMIGALRMIKLFAWERRLLSDISKKREIELQWIRYGEILGLVAYIVNTILPLINVVVTFGIYTMVMQEELTSSRLFTSMAIFNILRNQMFQVMFLLPTILKAKVSLDRLDNYLHKVELLDDASDQCASTSAPEDIPQNPAGTAGFKFVEFGWRRPNSHNRTVFGEAHHRRLKIAQEVVFKPCAINLIVGPTGSGKSSLLLALLGEMHVQSGGAQSWFGLPRNAGVAYACQEAWVLDETIKDNILFGSKFDEGRYQKVLTQCALTDDLSLFQAGDLTEVGERGQALSGGQKARIALARAVYSQADIVLLDDILAALDVHTSQEIVDKCLKGDLLQDRTVVLVSHNLALTRSLADLVIQVQRTGEVTSHETLSEDLRLDSFSEIEAHSAEVQAKKQEAIYAIEKSPPASLVADEEVLEGTVTWDSVSLWLKNWGSPLYWAVWLAFLWGEHALLIYKPYYLGQWSTRYEKTPASGASAVWWLAGYALLAAVELTVGIVSFFIWLNGNIRASRRIHENLLKSVVGATLRWLDATPSARIIARCTQDVTSVDQRVKQLVAVQLNLTASGCLKYLGIAYVAGWRAMVAGFIVSAIGCGVGRVYVIAQRSIKRKQSNAKSPILSLANTALSGLPSIRAYGAQEMFRRRMMDRINVYTRLSRTYADLSRWIAIRMVFLGSIFSAVVAAGVVYGDVLNSGRAGFALEQVLEFAMQVLFWVQISNSLEIECNSLERLNDFIKCDQEPAPTPTGIPPAYWPASGSLRVENLGAKYSKGAPEVLQNISFELRPGERVGIVGRTGAGKSTISLALLRGIPTSGKILYDGVDISQVNLDVLRSNITLIPQNPELMAGTIRDNLDPFKEYDDAILNDTLRSAGLGRLQHDGDPAVITLDSEVQGVGANFSLGQRQIIALARAQLRQSKLVIMDEATAAIDDETDAAIQQSIRASFSRDVTVITIAHRLQTIMDSDKIMALDGGRLVEFGAPKELLDKKGGLFFDLVERSPNKEALYRMVKA